MLYSGDLLHRSTPQIYSADLLRRSTPQIYSTDLLRRSTPIYSTDLLRRSTPIYSADLPHRSTPQIYSDLLHRSTPQIYSADLLPRSTPQIYSNLLHRSTPQIYSNLPSAPSSSTKATRSGSCARRSNLSGSTFGNPIRRRRCRWASGCRSRCAPQTSSVCSSKGAWAVSLWQLNAGELSVQRVLLGV